MHIEVSTVITGLLGLLGTVISIFLAVYSGLLKYTIAKRDEETTRRFERIDSENAAREAAEKALAERLRVDELETEKLRGRIAVLEAAQGAISSSLAEMKQQQVPRAEWERQIRTIEGQLATITGQLAQLVGHRGPLQSSHG